MKADKSLWKRDGNGMETSGNVWKMEHEMEPEAPFPSDNNRDDTLHFVKKEQDHCYPVYEGKLRTS